MFSVPVICTAKFNVIAAVVPCLSPIAAKTDRRQALLLLNNLCIPPENKAAILLGEPYKLLLPALLQIIASRMAESHLAAVCLYNLSFLGEGHSFLFHYVPPPVAGEPLSEYRHLAPLDNPTSLFRILESAVQDFLPFVSVAQDKPMVVSVEGEVVRWCLGLFSNIEKVNPKAVVTQSVLPHAAVQCLQYFSKHDLSLWKRDSLPDISLMLLVRLARDATCVAVLRRSQEARQVLESLEGRGGIHETRAKALLELLQQQEPAENALKTEQSQREEKKELEWV